MHDGVTWTIWSTPASAVVASISSTDTGGPMSIGVGLWGRSGVAGSQ